MPAAGAAFRYVAAAALAVTVPGLRVGAGGHIERQAWGGGSEGGSEALRARDAFEPPKSFDFGSPTLLRPIWITEHTRYEGTRNRSVLHKGIRNLVCQCSAPVIFTVNFAFSTRRLQIFGHRPLHSSLLALLSAKAHWSKAFQGSSLLLQHRHSAGFCGHGSASCGHSLPII